MILPIILCETETRWMCTRGSRDIGAQSRLLLTGARYACPSPNLNSFISHSPPFRPLSGQLSVLALCGRNFQHSFQPFLYPHISIRRIFVMEGVPAPSLPRGIWCTSSALTAAPVSLWISILRDFAGLCFGWAGQHSVPRDAPL